jgi:predicted phage terminase large subunit-like protein
LEPDRPLLWNWHYELICEYLQLVDEGKIRRLILNVPPRTAKSRFVTVLWPVWRWTRRPGLRWMFVSYADGLTRQHSRERRDVLESDWFVRRFGSRFSLATDQNTVTWFDNTQRGSMFSSSVGGTVTGKGGDVVVLDDPQDPAQAHSEAERTHVIEFCDRTLATRLDDPKTGTQVLVMQRLHEEDVTGHFMSQGGWTLLRLPMIAERDEEIVFPISGRKITRMQGDLLMPERFGVDEVADLKRRLGSYGAAAQLQQRPAPEEGGMIKRRWWGEYPLTPKVQAAACEEVLLSADLSFKDSVGADHVSLQAWGRSGANLYLLDRVNDKMDFPTTERAFVAFAAKWPEARAKLVEDKANGPALIASLKNKIAGIIPITPKDSKIARVHSVSPVIEAGNVLLPRPEHAPWVSDFLEQCSVFPMGAHDDDVDAMSQAVNRLAGSGRLFDMVAYARAQGVELSKEELDAIHAETARIEAEVAKANAAPAASPAPVPPGS